MDNKASPGNKLFLLDAMALIYRAYFAYSKNPLINSKQQNVSAIFGFTNTFMDVLVNEKPTHMAVAFDTDAPTGRHKEFAEYKAHRQAIPETIVESLPWIHRVIKAFNIPALIAPGYEADDIIGTMAHVAEKAGFTTMMMTMDKDFGQLVTGKTFLYKPARMGNDISVLGVKEVCERWDIDDPLKVADILGLAGDSSDNIPGVPGIGEKTAIELIKKYGTIENILAKTSELKGKQKENLEKFGEQALFSKRLATILRDAPVTFNEKELRIGRPDLEELKRIFSELEFRRPLERIIAWKPVKTDKEDQSLQPQLSIFAEDDTRESTAPETSPDGDDSGTPSGYRTLAAEPHQYHLVDTAEKRKILVSDMMKQKEFCFDTETTSVNPHDCEVVAVAFSWRPHEAYLVPVPSGRNEAEKILNDFIGIFSQEAIGKIGQNLKFDMGVLGQYGIFLNGKLFDTMVAHYLIEPYPPHNMDALAVSYLNYKPVPIEELIGKKGKNQGSMRDVELSRLLDYTCEDADITLQLRQVFGRMMAERNLANLFEKTEMKLVYVLAAMEREGVKVDTDALKKYSVDLDAEIRRIEKEIHDYAGKPFNIASPRQLGMVLFEELKITDRPKKTPTGQYSTREDVLEKLAEKHPVIQCILDVRELQKLKSTYVDVLPELINSRTGRIHTTFNQAIAVTGRLSSDNPNLQNIPIRTAKGREVRKAFVPRDENHLILSADYSQIELRIMAELSGDAALIEAFESKQDIHASTAARIYGKKINEITQEMRRKAKMVNFGIIYGMSAFGLSERLNIPRKEAAEIIGQYFNQYPGVKAYMEKIISTARSCGYVETLLGRKRYLPDINSQNATVRGNAERNAINTPIQGTAADMIKTAMISIHHEILRKKLYTRMILQVHDELVFDLYINEKDEVCAMVENKMKNALPMKVPVEVDMKTGRNWLEAHR